MTMKLRKLDPLKVKVPELRVTARFDNELYEQFKKSIAEAGQIAPIIVYQVGEEMVLCDGLHRLQEAIAHGDGGIDAVVLTGDMVDVLTKNIFLDHLRGKTPVSEMCKGITTLYQEYNLDSDQIRERTGLTRDYIERLIKVGQAGPAVLQAIDEGLIGVGIAGQLARIPSGAMRDVALAQACKFHYSVKDFTEYIDQALEELRKMQAGGAAPPPTATLPPHVYRCEGCQGVIQPKYLRPSLLCPTCFGRVFQMGQDTQAEEAQASAETPSP